MTTESNTLRTAVAHEVPGIRKMRIAVAIGLAVLATAIGAYIRVPLPWTPVPITLQPLFVMLAGYLLGPRVGGAAMLLYLVIGAMGFPVFSGGGASLVWLLGPTGGYLFAYPVAAVAVGFLAGKADSGLVRGFCALAVGMAIIYLGGVSQLAILSGDTLANLVALGVIPFLAGDLTKIGVALMLGRLLRKRTLESV